MQAGFAARRERLLLDRNIGSEIQRQRHEDRDTRFTDRLSRDLTHACPAMRGFATRNLKYMRLI